MNLGRSVRTTISLTAGGVTACVLAASSTPAVGSVAFERGAPAPSAKQRTLAYWTPARMLAAEPRERRYPAGASVRERVTLPTGAPGSIPPSDPSAGLTERVVPDFFGSYEVFEYTTRPQTANGKIFGIDRVGDFECSGTAVTAANQSVVITAGHCLYGRKYGWAKRITFVPSYYHGAAPFGVWAYREYFVPRNWYRKETWKNDLGAIVISPLNGATLETAVGSYGLIWNQPRAQNYRVTGYPTNYFDGERMMGCFGPYLGVKDGSTKIQCDLGTGSSGAGWVVQDLYVNSVMSFGLKGQPQFSYGPYFRPSAATLVNHAGSR